MLSKLKVEDELVRTETAPFQSYQVGRDKFPSYLIRLIPSARFSYKENL